MAPDWATAPTPPNEALDAQMLSPFPCHCVPCISASTCIAAAHTPLRRFFCRRSAWAVAGWVGGIPSGVASVIIRADDGVCVSLASVCGPAAFFFGLFVPIAAATGQPVRMRMQVSTLCNTSTLALDALGAMYHVQNPQRVASAAVDVDTLLRPNSTAPRDREMLAAGPGFLGGPGKSGMRTGFLSLCGSLPRCN